MNELVNLSLLETIALIKSRKISVKEVIEAYIKQLDNTDKYNMLSEKNYDEALVIANEIDTKKNQEFKPLEGIPIAVKDIFCTKGNKTTASSKMLHNFVAPYRLIGDEALSVDRATTFLTPASMAASMTFWLPITFVFTNSKGLYSALSTCFRAAAWTT